MNKTKALFLKLFGNKAKQVYFLLYDVWFFPIFTWRRLKTIFTWRVKVKKLLHSKAGLKLHLGCGEKNFNDMLNCEYRATKAADVVMDCGRLKRFNDTSVSFIFSHAFFEHLYKIQQPILLKDCFRVLKEDGFLIFLGIPDFETIAKAYLSKEAGIAGVGEIFDIEHVYRYTHGNPDGVAPNYWLAQLHKSLFDKKYIEALLMESGFKNFVIFNYRYPTEDISLNIGFVAAKSDTTPFDNINEMLTPFKEYIKADEDIQIKIKNKFT